MKNMRLHIAYDGTRYHGWQRQPNISTIEGELLAASATLLNCVEGDVAFQGASRTDAGVHALGQVANVKFEADRSAWDFVRGLNGMTPDDICVNHAELVDEDFNARFDSRGKWYRYSIWNHRFVDPFRHRQQAMFGPFLFAPTMQEAAQHLVGEHDFAAFQAADCQAKTSVREITSIEVNRDGHLVTIDVRGTAFLKNMVRVIAGTLISVGAGRNSTDWVKDALDSRDRQRAGVTAPACGLMLHEVFYPDHPWETDVGIGCWSFGT